MKKKSIRVVQKLVEKGVRNFTTYLATSAFQDSGLAFDLEAVQPPFFNASPGRSRFSDPEPHALPHRRPRRTALRLTKICRLRLLRQRLLRCRRRRPRSRRCPRNRLRPARHPARHPRARCHPPPQRRRRALFWTRTCELLRPVGRPSVGGSDYSRTAAPCERLMEKSAPQLRLKS